MENGKYRSKKDWSSSNPTLVDINEQNEDRVDDAADFNYYKPPTNRRGSLGINIFRRHDQEKNFRRRSSLANGFHLFSKRGDEKYENAVKFEKSDASLDTSLEFEQAECNFHASSPNNSGDTDIDNFNNSNDSVGSNDLDSGFVTKSNGSKTFSQNRRNSTQIKNDSKKVGSQYPPDRTNSISDISNLDQEQISSYLQSPKRHSIWNIFGHESRIFRTRRASQDVSTLSRSADNLLLNQKRNKSRSVDHGSHPPYDIDVIRAKVDGRFDSLTNEKKKTSLSQIPTTTYIVGDRDTLTSIAAKFETTPTALCHLNKLNTSFIYPGQQIVVPDHFASNKSEKDNASLSSSKAEGSLSLEEYENEKDILDGLKPNSPKPGRIERCEEVEPLNTTKDDQIITQRFLKINVKHITDGQGVVSGVLLVTPNAVMFDPNVSDTLVIEHGPEAYGVIAPMELVVNAAIFFDIAHMRVEGNTKGFDNIYEKVEIYYPKLISNQKSNDECIKEEKEKSSSVDEIENVKDTDSAKSENLDETDHDKQGTSLIINNRPTLEDRRKSLLDHHWARPSKERLSIDADSVVDHTQSSLESQEEIPEIIPNPDQTKKIYSDADIVLSSDWVPPRTIASRLNDKPPITSMGSSDSMKKKTTVNFSGNYDSVQFSSSENVDREDKKNKMMKRLSNPLTSFGFSSESDITSSPTKKSEADSAHNTDSNQSVFSKVFSSSPITLVSELSGNLFSKTPSEDSGGSPIPPITPHSTHSEGFITGRASLGAFIRPLSSESINPNSKLKDKPHLPKLDYRSMVSMDDMPDLFASFDKLIARPAKACQDPPLYLRLRMGKPIGKDATLPTTVMSYGKNKLRPEYWFSIPRNRVDELYRLIKTWIPHLYGELNEEEINKRGYELVHHDTEWTKEGRKEDKDDGGEDIVKLTTESWEVLTMNDDFQRNNVISTGSFDMEFPIPDLNGQTEILTEDHREKLANQLPARAEGYTWTLVFSTSQHGFSLNSLYRKMQKLDSPILIVIEDTDNNVFGALTSEALHISDHFYGNGESMLFKFNPDFRVFHWSGHNSFIIKGDPESVSIGAEDGKYGLWFDGNLNKGRSEPCSTFENKTLSTQEDFVIKTLECWAFV